MDNIFWVWIRSMYRLPIHSGFVKTIDSTSQIITTVKLDTRISIEANTIISVSRYVSLSVELRSHLNYYRERPDEGRAMSALFR